MSPSQDSTGSFAIALPKWYNEVGLALAKQATQVEDKSRSMRVLIVDDVDLVFNPDGILEPVFGNANVKYKATSGKLIVNTANKASLSVIDMSGKMVFNNRVNEGTSEFTLNDLTEGIYAFVLTDDAAANISSGKFIIQ